MGDFYIVCLVRNLQWTIKPACYKSLAIAQNVCHILRCFRYSFSQTIPRFFKSFYPCPIATKFLPKTGYELKFVTMQFSVKSISPQVGEVTAGWLPYLSCKRDQIKMRDYTDMASFRCNDDSEVLVSLIITKFSSLFNTAVVACVACLLIPPATQATAVVIIFPNLC